MLLRCILLVFTALFFVGTAGCGNIESGEDSRITPVRLPGGKSDFEDAFEATRPEECPGGAPLLPGGSPANWTVMVYAAADNDLEEFVIEDINEMEVGYAETDQVNVVVQLDRMSLEGVWRYRIAHDDDRSRIASPLVGWSEEEPDSGNWQTLSSFGEWAATCYPAYNFMLIVEGHGNGWMDRSPRAIRNRNLSNEAGETFREIAFDETNGSSIYIAELARALNYIASRTRLPWESAGAHRIVIYGSDACLMQTIEVGWQARDGAKIILGSEASEPATGWPYDAILQELTARPFHYSEMPHELARVVTQHYGLAYVHSGSTGESRITLSAVNAAALPAAVARMKRIAPLLEQLLPEIHRHVWSARDRSFDFGETYADLVKFLLELRAELIRDGKILDGGSVSSSSDPYQQLRDEIDAVERMVPELVVAQTIGSKFQGAAGISIFFPYRPTTWFLDLEKYAHCPFAVETGWGEFIAALIQNYPYQ